MKNTVNEIKPVGRVFSYNRWSSEPQTWGDSERRQDELAKTWCAGRGLELAERRFVDRGVSAWKGANRERGGLGDLPKIVRQGDTILIEDVDRFSRQDPVTTLANLREVVNRGIQVVLLKSGTVVTQENSLDASVLIPSFFQSFLANAENEKRAYRIREAMKARRSQLEKGRAVKGAMPCWLRWSDETKTAVVIEEKAQAVRQLFALSLDGYGVHTIVQMMAGTPCPTKGQRSRWNSRPVHRLLNDKSVIGHYARTEQSIPGVFPAIVTEEDFFASLEKMKARSNCTVPRKYANSSLFTALAKAAKPVAPSPLDVLRGRLAEVQAQANKIMMLIDGQDTPPKRLG